MVGAHHVLRSRRLEVGDVALQPGQGTRFGLEVTVDAAAAGGELDEPVPLHRRLPGDRLLRFDDLLGFLPLALTAAVRDGRLVRNVAKGAYPSPALRPRPSASSLMIKYTRWPRPARLTTRSSESWPKPVCAGASSWP